jgi:lipoate-protein ligase A
MDIRLILDFERPTRGAQNMAIDEALLESVEEEGPALRLYAWDQPTLSLGYFQGWRNRLRHPPSSGLPTVRRSTGGGAIVHDHELTYCWVFPASLRRSADADYAFFHGSWITALERAGWNAHLVQTHGTAAPCGAAMAGELSDRGPTSEEPREPFLCFQRRTAQDVVLAGYKILGSAQRRRSGAGLQHGSLILRASPAAPELPGLTELTGVSWTRAIAAERWLGAIGAATGWKFREVPVTATVQRLAERILQDRHGRTDWLTKR